MWVGELCLGKTQCLLGLGSWTVEKYLLVSCGQPAPVTLKSPVQQLGWLRLHPPQRWISPKSWWRDLAPCCLAGGLALALWLSRLGSCRKGLHHALWRGWWYGWFANAWAGFWPLVLSWHNAVQCFSLLLPLLKFRLNGIRRITHLK